MVAYLGVITFLFATWHVQSGSKLWQIYNIGDIIDILQPIKAITSDITKSLRPIDAYRRQWSEPSLV